MQVITLSAAAGAVGAVGAVFSDTALVCSVVIKCYLFLSSFNRILQQQKHH